MTQKIKSLHTIYISVGSNIQREQHVRAGLHAMYHAFGELRLSSVYESEAVGFSGTHFYNLVVQAHTTDTVQQVCVRLKKIEEENQRIRGDKKFAPRTLDLDLLLYDDIVDDELVELPRAEILFNAFVLQPLAEIAATEMHPLVGRTYQSLWNDYDKSKQKLWPIEFIWKADPQ
ncbi:MAG: 2-amino-4-hydroxy-6-hydroxymethyldihydropteridine diphosphokinase [Paraglaciecola sp.]